MQSYHKQVAIRSWYQTVNIVAGKTNSERVVRFLTFLISMFFAYLWVENIDRNSEAFSDTQLAAMLAAGVFTTLFVACLAAHLLWLVPWEIWLENRREIETANSRLKPRLQIKNFGPQSLKSIEFGNSLVSLAGTRQIVIGDWSKGVFLTVENPSSETMHGIHAYLARFSKIGEPDDQWESLHLAWVPSGEPSDGIDLPSGGSRNIWMFSSINNLLQFRVTQMPVNMISAVQPKGEYEGLVVVSATGVAATHIPFTLLCDGPENPPVMTVSRLDD